MPAELADALHDTLRRHFQDDPTVEVVVDHRLDERRSGRDRRRAVSAPPDPPRPGGERRRIQGAAGRRIADRRVPTLEVDVPPLPRRARRHADRIAFIERIEPASQEREDTDIARLVATSRAKRDPFAAAVASSCATAAAAVPTSDAAIALNVPPIWRGGGLKATRPSAAASMSSRIRYDRVTMRFAAISSSLATRSGGSFAATVRVDFWRG